MNRLSALKYGLSVNESERDKCPNQSACMVRPELNLVANISNALESQIPLQLRFLAPEFFQSSLLLTIASLIGRRGERAGWIALIAVLVTVLNAGIGVS